MDEVYNPLLMVLVSSNTVLFYPVKKDVNAFVDVIFFLE